MIQMEVDSRGVTGEVTCGYRNCDKEHPCSCCHSPVTVREPSGRRGFVMLGWRCLYCPKETKHWQAVRGVPDKPGEAIINL